MTRYKTGCRICLALLVGFIALHVRCDNPREAPRGEATAPALARRSAGPGITVKLAEGAELSLVLPGRALVIDLGADPPSAVSALDGGTRVARSVRGRIRIEALESAGPLEIRLVAAGEGSREKAGGQDLILLDAAAPGSGSRRAYRGSFLIESAGERLVLSNRLLLEDYLAGVVASEMPASAYPLEALKAQAVASRTYALHALLRAEARGSRRSVLSDQRFQVYGGKEREHPRAAAAVEATSGEVLFHGDALFRAYFHASCGGRTTDAAKLFGEPAIEPLLGSECGACEGSPSFRWSARISRADLDLALGPWAASRGVRAGSLLALEVSERAADGRASYLRVRHERGSYEIHAEALRRLSGKTLRSTRFEITPEAEGWRFDGLGHGHGAGLCQVGAAARAASASCAEILAAYYPGSRIEKVY